jgi:LPXTG-site transpeptidase (sortase) family protein
MASMGYIGAGMGDRARRLRLPALRLPWRFNYRIPHARGLLVFAVLFGMTLAVASAAGLLALRQTDAAEESAQAALRRQFLAGLVAAPVELVNEPLAEGAVPAPVQFLPEQAPPAAGAPLAVIRIPAIGVDKVVVQGTGTDQLRMGPGHYPGTALPGEGGTVGIAGFRATYGAPFLKLDDLKPGNEIFLSAVGGEFVYQVTSRKTVKPYDNSSLVSETHERLVLTTTAPSLKDDRRLVLTATLKNHSKRGAATLGLPAGSVEEGYEESPITESFELNPLGRLAATNVTPRTAPPAAAAAAPPAPAPAPAPPADQAQPPAPEPPPPPPPAPQPPPPPPPAPLALTPPPAPAPRAAPPSPTPTGPVHRSPNPYAPACRNGMDDDGDGLIDFRSLDGERQDKDCNGLDDDDE